MIEVVGLAEKTGRACDKLSGGQQRRLDVAIALAGDPELLFLDEPTTGFDPSARRNAWEMVKNLVSLGKTVFLTTHFMDEAQYLADRVAVIAGGRDRRRGAAGERSPVATRCGHDPVPASRGRARRRRLGAGLDRRRRASRLQVERPDTRSCTI